MRIAILNVTEHVLVQALRLPEGTRIEDVRMSFIRPKMLEFRITSDGLKDVPEGNAIPEVTATFKAEYVDGQQKEVTFTGWQY